MPVRYGAPVNPTVEQGMHKTTKIIIGLAATLVLVLGLSFVGVYREREWPDDLHCFIKHRPTFKLVFRAPRGEAEAAEASLSPAERKEEELYAEFVEEGAGDSRSIYLPITL